MSKMKYLILFVFTLSIATSRSQKCGINDPQISFESQTIRPNPIDDTGALDLVVGFTGNVAVSTPDDTDSGAPYIDASVNAEDQTIIIKTNDNFATSFDENTPRQTATYVTILRTILITCESEDISLLLTLYVSDTNNHDPTFSASSYTYQMPMPLMPNVDLTALGDALIAEDVDFSQTDLTFTVDPPDYFSLNTEVIPDTKQYKAILKATEYVRFDTGRTLTITASDGLRTAQSTINIERDDSSSLPIAPQFSEQFYVYIYSDDDGAFILTPVQPDQEILVTTSDPSLTEVTISNATYVNAFYDGNTNIVQIVSTGTFIPSGEVVVLSLTVTLNNQSTQSVVVIRNLQGQVCEEVPIFEHPTYTGVYEIASSGSQDTVVLNNGPINIVEPDPNVRVSIINNDITNFGTVQYVGGWIVTVDTNLDPILAHSGGSIVLTLQATGNSGAGFCTLIIYLPSPSRN